MLDLAEVGGRSDGLKQAAQEHGAPLKRCVGSRANSLDLSARDVRIGTGVIEEEFHSFVAGVAHVGGSGVWPPNHERGQWSLGGSNFLTIHATSARTRHQALE